VYYLLNTRGGENNGEEKERRESTNARTIKKLDKHQQKYPEEKKGEREEQRRIKQCLFIPLHFDSGSYFFDIFF
jgi:hypothetical protein